MKDLSLNYSLLVFLLTLQHFFAPLTEACFAAGVCGGGGGCAPPPPPVCQGGCGQGYGCGQYGCHRLRARVASSKTLRIAKPRRGEEFEGEEEAEASAARRPQTPDEKFMACCQERNLPDTCLDKCSFRTYTKAALQNMYFRADPCPMQAASDMQFCAAQGRDHRECCQRNGVASTMAGEKCLTFCNQVPGNVTQLDLSYFACYDRFENMKACDLATESLGQWLHIGCFWHDITRRQQPQRDFQQK